jgi:hypothetical protein
LFALNLDPDGTSFWTGDIGGDDAVFRIDLASGAVLKTFSTFPGTELGGLAIFGEITQGGGGPTTAPEPATFALLFTGLSGLAGVTMIRRSKRNDTE